MSLDASTPLAVAAPHTWISRVYQGHYVTAHLDGGATLKVTHNHPILTHAGWVPARELRAGVRVVAHDGAAAVTRPAGVEVAEARQRGTWRVATSRRDFWGDAGSDRPCVSPAAAATAPMHGGMLVGEEGERPALDPWSLLAALTSPQAFGVGTWAAACREVPGLDWVWPHGQPTAQTAGLGGDARVRLGVAADVLPKPPVDLTGWAQRFTGLAGTLRYVRVDRVASGIGGGQVCDIIGGSGCAVAGGIVVA